MQSKIIVKTDLVLGSDGSKSFWVRLPRKAIREQKRARAYLAVMEAYSLSRI